MLGAVRSHGPEAGNRTSEARMGTLPNCYLRCGTRPEEHSLARIPRRRPNSSSPRRKRFRAETESVSYGVKGGSVDAGRLGPRSTRRAVPGRSSRVGGAERDMTSNRARMTAGRLAAVRLSRSM